MDNADVLKFAKEIKKLCRNKKNCNDCPFDLSNVDSDYFCIFEGVPENWETKYLKEEVNKC